MNPYDVVGYRGLPYDTVVTPGEVLFRVYPSPSPTLNSLSYGINVSVTRLKELIRKAEGKPITLGAIPPYTLEEVRSISPQLLTLTLPEKTYQDDGNGGIFIPSLWDIPDAWVLLFLVELTKLAEAFPKHANSILPAFWVATRRNNGWYSFTWADPFDGAQLEVFSGSIKINTGSNLRNAGVDRLKVALNRVETMQKVIDILGYNA